MACANFHLETPLELPALYKACNEPLTVLQAADIENRTSDQAACPLWHKLRKGILTSSNFGRVIKRKKFVHDNFLASLFGLRPFTSAATSYGQENEELAKKKYLLSNPNSHIQQCGLVVNPKFSFLGASPDGKVLSDGEMGIIEVKCPYTARNMTIKQAIGLLPNFYLKETDDIVHLKRQHNYFYQVQGQLMITGAPYCDFVVYTPYDMHIERIIPDHALQQQMLDGLAKFFLNHALPFMRTLSENNES